MERPDLEAIGRRLQAAKDMVSKLCHGDQKWIMSIPARPGVDPDLVIGEAQRDASTLLTYCRELEAENRRLRAVSEELVEREKACGSMAVDDATILQMAREIVEAQQP